MPTVFLHAYGLFRRAEPAPAPLPPRLAFVVRGDGGGVVGRTVTVPSRRYLRGDRRLVGCIWDSLVETLVAEGASQLAVGVVAVDDAAGVAGSVSGGSTPFAAALGIEEEDADADVGRGMVDLRDLESDRWQTTWVDLGESGALALRLYPRGCGQRAKSPAEKAQRRRGDPPAGDGGDEPLCPVPERFFLSYLRLLAETSEAAREVFAAMQEHVRGVVHKLMPLEDRARGPKVEDRERYQRRTNDLFDHIASLANVDVAERDDVREVIRAVLETADVIEIDRLVLRTVPANRRVYFAEGQQERNAQVKPHASYGRLRPQVDDSVKIHSPRRVSLFNNVGEQRKFARRSSQTHELAHERVVSTHFPNRIRRSITSPAEVVGLSPPSPAESGSSTPRPRSARRVKLSSSALDLPLVAPTSPLSPSALERGLGLPEERNLMVTRDVFFAALAQVMLIERWGDGVDLEGVDLSEYIELQFARETARVERVLINMSIPKSSFPPPIACVDDLYAVRFDAGFLAIDDKCMTGEEAGVLGVQHWKYRNFLKARTKDPALTTFQKSQLVCRIKLMMYAQSLGELVELNEEWGQIDTPTSTPRAMTKRATFLCMKLRNSIKPKEKRRLHRVQQMVAPSVLQRMKGYARKVKAKGRDHTAVKLPPPTAERVSRMVRGFQAVAKEYRESGASDAFREEVESLFAHIADDAESAVADHVKSPLQRSPGVRVARGVLREVLLCLVPDEWMVSTFMRIAAEEEAMEVRAEENCEPWGGPGGGGGQFLCASPLLGHPAMPTSPPLVLAPPSGSRRARLHTTSPRDPLLPATPAADSRRVRFENEDAATAVITPPEITLSLSGPRAEEVPRADASFSRRLRFSTSTVSQEPVDEFAHLQYFSMRSLLAAWAKGQPGPRQATMQDSSSASAPVSAAGLQWGLGEPPPCEGGGMWTAYLEETRLPDGRTLLPPVGAAACEQPLQEPLLPPSSMWACQRTPSHSLSKRSDDTDDFAHLQYFSMRSMLAAYVKGNFSRAAPRRVSWADACLRPGQSLFVGHVTGDSLYLSSSHTELRSGGGGESAVFNVSDATCTNPPPMTLPHTKSIGDSPVLPEFHTHPATASGTSLLWDVRQSSHASMRSSVAPAGRACVPSGMLLDTSQSTLRTICSSALGNCVDRARPSGSRSVMAASLVLGTDSLTASAVGMSESGSTPRSSDHPHAAASTWTWTVGSSRPGAADAAGQPVLLGPEGSSVPSWGTPGGSGMDSADGGRPDQEDPPLCSWEDAAAPAYSLPSTSLFSAPQPHLSFEQAAGMSPLVAGAMGVGIPPTVVLDVFQVPRLPLHLEEVELVESVDSTPPSSPPIALPPLNGLTEELVAEAIAEDERRLLAMMVVPEDEGDDKGEGEGEGDTSASAGEDALDNHRASPPPLLDVSPLGDDAADTASSAPPSDSPGKSRTALLRVDSPAPPVIDIDPAPPRTPLTPHGYATYNPARFAAGAGGASASPRSPSSPDAVLLRGRIGVREFLVLMTAVLKDPAAREAIEQAQVALVLEALLAPAGSPASPARTTTTATQPLSSPTLSVMSPRTPATPLRPKLGDAGPLLGRRPVGTPLGAANPELSRANTMYRLKHWEPAEGEVLRRAVAIYKHRQRLLREAASLAAAAHVTPREHTRQKLRIKLTDYAEEFACLHEHAKYDLHRGADVPTPPRSPTALDVYETEVIGRLVREVAARRQAAAAARRAQRERDARVKERNRGFRFDRRILQHAYHHPKDAAKANAATQKRLRRPAPPPSPSPRPQTPRRERLYRHPALANTGFLPRQMPQAGTAPVADSRPATPGAPVYALHHKTREEQAVVAPPWDALNDPSDRDVTTRLGMRRGERGTLNVYGMFPAHANRAKRAAWRGVRTPAPPSRPLDRSGDARSAREPRPAGHCRIRGVQGGCGAIRSDELVGFDYRRRPTYLSAAGEAPGATQDAWEPGDYTHRHKAFREAVPAAASDDMREDLLRKQALRREVYLLEHCR